MEKASRKMGIGGVCRLPREGPALGGKMYNSRVTDVNRPVEIKSWSVIERMEQSEPQCADYDKPVRSHVAKFSQ